MIKAKRNLIPLMLIALTMGAAGSVAGCNTIKGAGKDVSSTGKAVTDVAADTQAEINK